LDGERADDRALSRRVAVVEPLHEWQAVTSTASGRELEKITHDHENH
jgi:hypothetical protein